MWEGASFYSPEAQGQLLEEEHGKYSWLQGNHPDQRGTGVPSLALIPGAVEQLLVLCNKLPRSLALNKKN